MEQRRSGRFGVDGIRDGDRVVGGYGDVFGVGRLAHVGYACADGEVGGGVGADGGDGTGAFAAEGVGEGGGVVDA